jgi:hypothetical protein
MHTCPAIQDEEKLKVTERWLRTAQECCDRLVVGEEKEEEERVNM